MMWSGSGIVGYRRVSIQPDFSPETTLALTWIELSNGAVTAVDRGYQSDTYDTTFTVAGKLAAVESALTLIELNRTYYGSNQLITITQVESTEHIFGEDVDHNGLTMTITEVGPITQRSWQVYGVTIRARAVSPSFLGTPSLPAFRNIHIGRTATTNRTDNKMDTYYGTFTNLDHCSDSGRAELSAAFTLANIKALRGQLATIRGGDMYITTSGAWSLFGPSRDQSSLLPVKVLKYADGGRFGLTHRIMKFTLAEVI